uniref:Arf-GAP domain-containing protein n=1 Tax=Heterorhabditis bacteriophora TaxID=37862 RepID=A0A1I7XFM3_HETBA
MATFSMDEVERIRSLGNNENARTWLGLYGGTPPAMTNKEDITAFLIKKYEKKQWYVPPSELVEQERLLNKAKEVANSSNSNKYVNTTGVKTCSPSVLDLFSSDPFATLGPASTSTRPSAVVSHSLDFPSMQPHVMGAFEHQPAQCSSTNQLPPKPLKPQLIDPFASMASNSSAQSKNNFDVFADFDAKFGDMTVKTSSTVTTIGNTVTIPTVSKPPTNAAFHEPIITNGATPFTNPFQPISMVPIVPLIPSSVSTMRDESYSHSLPVSIPNTTGADKYSALAELDEMFHHGGNSAPKDGDNKPTWVPSGFSTGLPPTCATAFPEPKHGQPTAFSMPKSSTMGTLADFGGSLNCFPAHTATFQQQIHTISQKDLSASPYTAYPSGYAQKENPYQNHGQVGFNVVNGVHLSNGQDPGLQQKGWTDPFKQHLNGEEADSKSVTGSSTTQKVEPPPIALSKWNPFL